MGMMANRCFNVFILQSEGMMLLGSRSCSFDVCWAKGEANADLFLCLRLLVGGGSVAESSL